MKAFFAGIIKIVDFVTRILDGIAERRRRAQEIKRRAMEEAARQKYREANK